MECGGQRNLCFTQAWGLSLIITYFLTALILDLSGWRFYEETKFIGVPRLGRAKEWFLLHSVGKNFRKSVLKLLLATAVMLCGVRGILESFNRICNIRDAILVWRIMRSTQENRVLCRIWGIPPPFLRPIADRLI